ncbi:hypothetical protein [Actinomadura atramentaria]|uniref:hypothetical protein n=1 Tax=Actinomadura atramentaria TaxID=1990 RepID=UPI00037ABB84|nr:hypothetical protein [Actinomadura atramentaria]
MTRTTPPRPVDIAAVFPDLAPLARTATRLHPRSGAPGVRDSSVGGPLLWPADEPWPTCSDEHYEPGDLVRPADVRARRAILSAAWGRTPLGAEFAITRAERAELDRIEARRFAGTPDGPIPLLPVAQLFARDVPDLPTPPGADLLQVLWCPFHHADRLYCPAVTLRWRNAADVRAVLAGPPEPPAIETDDYLPAPCVLHPERVTEYPYVDLLPRDLRDRLERWEEETGHDYFGALSVADGWKVGGHANWNLTDPYPMTCDCGTERELLLRIDSGEWDSDASWRPVEDAWESDFHEMPHRRGATEVVIGRGYSLWVFRCPASFDHPLGFSME